MLNILLIILSCVLNYSLLAENKECIFCQPAIIERQTIFQTKYWHVLIDYKPVVEGHLLIVPIAHRLTRYELTLEEHLDLYHLENQLHSIFQKRFGNSINDLQYEKNGPILQSVNHFHIHLIPISESQGSFFGKLWLMARLFLLPSPTLSNEKLEKEKLTFQKLFNELKG